MTIMLVKDTVAAIVAAALEQANRDGVISVDTAADIEIERPNNPEHGDFATNLPLRLARAARANPMQLAQLIAERIQPGPEIASVEPTVTPASIAPITIRSSRTLTSRPKSWNGVSSGGSIRV